MPKISVIIATYNRCESLKNTLDSLLTQEIDVSFNWELIVADNNSKDETKKTVESYKQKFDGRLKYLFEPRQGKSYALNAAIKEAGSEIIAFTDDDCILDRSWLKNYSSIYWNSYLRMNAGYFFGGPVQSEFESYEFNKEILAYAPFSVKGLDLGNDKKIINKNEYFIGGNWACPKRYLDEINGFDISKGLNPSIRKVRVGEETDVMKKLKDRGYHGLYLPGAKVKHYVPLAKCTIKHIGDRVEASGYDITSDSLESFGNKKIFGLPRWMIKKLFILMIKNILNKVSRRENYKDFFSFRHLIGQVDAVRNSQKSQKFN